MCVFHNYQQLFNLMIILDSCRDFLTCHQTHHMYLDIAVIHYLTLFHLRLLAPLI